MRLGALVLTILMAGCGPAGRAARAEATLPEVDEPIAVGDGEDTDGAGSAGLLALLDRHLPSTWLPPGASLGLPRDWKQLPQSSVRWRAELPIAGSGAVQGGVVVVPLEGSFVALDAETGELRWSRDVVAPSETSAPIAVEGCGDVVALVHPGRIEGVDLRSGHQRFSVPIEDALNRFVSSRSEMFRWRCSLVYRTDASGRTTSQAASEVRMLDLTTGSVRVVYTCSGVCVPFADGADDGLLIRDGAQSVLVRPSDGHERRLGHLARYVVGEGADEILVTLARDGVHVVRADGTDRVVHPIADVESRVLVTERRGDLLLLASRGAIEAIDLSTGTRRWSIPIGADHDFGVGAFVRSELSGSRWLLEWLGPAWTFVVIDPETGRAHPLRLAPGRTGLLGIDDDLAFLVGDDEVLASPLDDEAPPIRTLLSLEQDVERSLAYLPRANQPKECDGSPQAFSPHLHPVSCQDAQGWLRRLAPDIVPTLTEIARRAPFEQLGIIAGVVLRVDSAETRALFDLALRRTLDRMPDRVTTLVRREVAAAYGHQALAPDLADDLSKDALRWLGIARSRGWMEPSFHDYCENEHDRRCWPRRQLWQALQTTQGLLGRGSTDPAPLLALRRALVDADPALSCPRSEDAEVVQTLVDTWFAFSTPESFTVLAPHHACVRIRSAFGQAAVLQDDKSDRYPHLRFDVVEPWSGDRPRWGDPAWDDAPMVRVEATYTISPNATLPYRYRLVRVGGVWRIVSGQ